MGFFSFLKNEYLDFECPCCTRELDITVKGKCFEQVQTEYIDENYFILGLFTCDYCKKDITFKQKKSTKAFYVSIYDEDQFQIEMEEKLYEIENRIEEYELLLEDNIGDKKLIKLLESSRKLYDKIENTFINKIEKIDNKCLSVTDRLQNRNRPPKALEVIINGNMIRLEE